MPVRVPVELGPYAVSGCPSCAMKLLWQIRICQGCVISEVGCKTSGSKLSLAPGDEVHGTASERCINASRARRGHKEQPAGRANMLD